jgi:hypothetical protein
VLKDFYLALAPVCFTLLGLWVIVAQTRHAEWRRSPRQRRRGYAVWLQFALPGLMSLLALVDTSSEALWRASFATVGIAGVVILATLWNLDRSHASALLYGGIALLYAIVVVLAIAPALVNHFDASFNALRTEAVLLCALVFVGVNVAWFLLFEGDAADTP